MSAGPSDGDARPQPGDGPSRATVIVMALVALISLLIFVWGFESLILDRDIVEEADAGPLVGPAMVVALGVVVLVALRRPEVVERPVRSAVAAGLASLIAAPVAGAVVYALASGELAASVVFVGGHVLDPFVLAAAVVAAVVVFGFGLVLRAR